MGNVFSAICPCMKRCTKRCDTTLGPNPSTYFLCYFFQKKLPAMSDYVVREPDSNNAFRTGCNIVNLLTIMQLNIKWFNSTILYFRFLPLYIQLCNDRGPSMPSVELEEGELCRYIDRADQKLSNECVMERLIIFGTGHLSHIFRLPDWECLLHLHLVDDGRQAQGLVVTLSNHTEAAQFLVSKKDPELMKNLPFDVDHVLGALCEVELDTGIPDLTREPFMKSSVHFLQYVSMFSHQLTEEFARGLCLHSLHCEMMNDENEENLRKVKANKMFLQFSITFDQVKLFKLDPPFNPYVGRLQLSWFFPDNEDDIFLDRLPGFVQKLKDCNTLEEFIITNAGTKKFEILDGRWLPSVDRWPEVSRVLDMMRLNLLNKPKKIKPLKFDLWFGQKFCDSVNNFTVTAVFIIRRRKLYLELFDPTLNLRIPAGRNLRSMNNQEIIHFTKTRIIQYYKLRNGLPIE